MNYRETISRLNAALNNIDLAYAVIAKKYGLTFNALMMICLINDTENVTQKKICNALYLPKSTVHSILLDFIKQDYISLAPGSNRKEKFVVFTAEGNKHFSTILETVQLFEDKVLAALGDETCSILIESAEKLGEIIIEEITDINNGRTPE